MSKASGVRAKEPDKFDGSKPADTITRVELGAGEFITMKTKSKFLRIKAAGANPENLSFDMPFEVMDDAGRPILRIEKR